MRRAASLLLLSVIASPAWASIAGTVWSPSGDPLAGARVVVRRPQTSADRRASVLSPTAQVPLASTTTDAQGAFRVEQNIDGMVVVSVERDGHAPAWKLTTGDDQDVAFELARAAQRMGRISTNGKAVAGALVVAVNGGTPLWSARSGDDGTFGIPDPSGWASEIAIVHSDFAPRETKPRSLEVTLAKGETAKGTVVDARGRPVAGARVSAGPWTTTTTAEDGTFTLTNIPPDVKKLEAFLGESSGSAARAPQGATISIAEQPSISGTVRDANKRPLPYAVMMAWHQKSQTVKTAVADERGRYRIDHCEEGSYLVTPSDTSTLSFPHATAAAGATGVDFAATPHDYLTGIVVDEQKRPVAGATVQYSQPQYPLLYGHLSSDASGSARTGRDGRFKLRAGEDVRAYAARIPLRLRALRRGHALAISEGVDFKGSVTLTLPSGIELQGMVVDANGQAVAGAGVVAVQDPYGAVPLPLDVSLRAGKITAFVETDTEGKFTLRLNPAQHDFGVWKEGRGAGRIGSFDVAPGTGPLKIVLEQGVAIRGRVIAPGAKSIGGMIVANGEATVLGYAEVDEDGIFTVDGIRPGTYTLQYMDQETGREAQVSAKAPSDGVTIELQANGAIRGRVVDAATQEVLRSYTVTASPKYERRDIEDEESFTLDLPPGDTMVKVEAKGYQDATQQVTVTAGETADVTISANRGRIVGGRVTNELGSPVGDAMITADEIGGFASSADDGSYTITLPVAPVSVSVYAKGYARKELALAADSGERLDVVLSRGKQARGRVVTDDGAPVAGAEVTAAGAGFPQEARTDDDGTFLVEGLGDGLYTFYARRNELESERLEKVDPAAGEIVLRMKPSAGSGAVHGRVKGFTEGGWFVGFVQAGHQHAMIGRDGRYRFEKLPAGEVELRAIASGMNENTSSSRSVKVTVIANGDVEADVEFNTSTVIRGTVYEDDKAAPFRSVQFYANDMHWSAQTNQNGEYTITGPEPGMNCRVLVTGNQRSFETQHQVTGSTTFDIRIAWSRIEGRVTDEIGTPLAAAKIEVRRDGVRDTTDTKTDATGTFAVTIPRSDGAYSVTVELEGFATATQRAIAGGAPLLVTMARTDGLRVRLVDARTGATLDGYAIAVDEAGQLLARAQDQKPDGTLRLPVRAGTYRVAVSASGYASQLTTSAAPRTDELRVALTPGGSLIVNTDRESNDAIKLVMPNGEEYVQCQCNGIAEIRLTGTRTEVAHVAPGAYSMRVLDARGLIKASHPVTIAEGQTTTIAIHLPE